MQQPLKRQPSLVKKRAMLKAGEMLSDAVQKSVLVIFAIKGAAAADSSSPHRSEEPD